MNGIIISKLLKIKKRNFKKNLSLLDNFNKNQFFLKKNLSTYKKYFFSSNKSAVAIKTPQQNISICISQKKNNPKATIFKSNTLNTLSVGSTLKYFKIKQGKYVRRSLKGTKLFLNFLKNIFEKKYINKKYIKSNCVILNVAGFDYNLLYLKRFFKSMLVGGGYSSSFFLFNLKISFTKKKEKRMKSIKKRLKKKMLSVFLKNAKHI